MRKIVLSLILLASVVSANEDQIGVEAIGGVVIVEDGVTVVVRSGGCTQKEDFVVVVNQNEDGPAEILINRVRYDFCKQVPFLEEIHFSYRDLGIDRDKDFRIINPISNRANFCL